MEQIFLQDNVRITIYNTDKFKSETLGVYFAIKARKEDIVKRNILSAVLKRGCEGYPTIKEMNERLDELYATIINSKTRKIGDVWYFGINADMVGNDYTENEDVLSGVVDMIKRILFCPILNKKGLFKDEYVKSEIELYRSLILSQINSPRSYSMLRCREHTLSERNDILTLEEIIKYLDKTKNKDIFDFYKYVLENAGLEIFYVGNRTKEEIVEYFKDITKFVKSNELSLVDLSKNELNSNAKEIFEEKPISQGRIAISIDTKTFGLDKDFYSVVLFNEILGGSPVSKLFMNVREKLSLCYECSSSYDSKEGIIFLRSGIDVKNYKLAKSAMLKEYESVRNGDFSLDELDSAKKSVSNMIRAILDNPQQIENNEFTRMISKDNDDVDTFIKKINETKKEDIVKASEKFLINTVYFLSGNKKGEGKSDDEE